MTDTKTAAPTCTRPTAPDGFTLPCPRCTADGSISINLFALDGDECFTCNECEESFGFDFVRDLLARWQPILSWLAAVPQPSEDE